MAWNKVISGIRIYTKEWISKQYLFGFVLLSGNMPASFSGGDIFYNRKGCRPLPFRQWQQLAGGSVIMIFYARLQRV